MCVSLLEQKQKYPIEHIKKCFSIELVLIFRQQSYFFQILFSFSIQVSEVSRKSSKAFTRNCIRMLKIHVRLLLLKAVYNVASVVCPVAYACMERLPISWNPALHLRCYSDHTQLHFYILYTVNFSLLDHMLPYQYFLCKFNNFYYNKCLM